MYDFAGAQIKLIDLESYRRGPYVNDVGRLPGSTRFMAPEEFTAGATLDSRTTVYNLGRMIEYFLLDRHPLSAVAAVATRATAHVRDRRHPTLADLQAE